MVYYKPDIRRGKYEDLSNKALIIGSNIRKMRIKRGISATDLAEKIGVKKSTVSNYENARSVPRPDTLKKIAEILETSVENITSANARVLKSDEENYMDGRIPYFGDITAVALPNAVPDAIFPQISGFEDGKSFFVRINGDDFEDLGIYSSAVVLFDPCAQPDKDKIVALNIESGRLARVESVKSNKIKLIVYDDEGSYIKSFPTDSDVILGVGVMYTAFM